MYTRLKWAAYVAALALAAIVIAPAVAHAAQARDGKPVVATRTSRPALHKTYLTRIYTVRPGDTLSSIGLRYGVTVDQLAIDNHVSDPNLILDGQKLQISHRPVTGHVVVPALVPTPSATSPTPSAAPEAAPESAPSEAPSGGFESCVIERESGGDPDASNGSHWGLFQMTPELYAAAGGTDYGSASAAEQEQVFDTIMANDLNGGANNWAPWDGC